MLELKIFDVSVRTQHAHWQGRVVSVSIRKARKLAEKVSMSQYGINKNEIVETWACEAKESQVWAE